MNVYHAARTAYWSRRRLFGIFRPSFSRHITQVSAVRYLPPFRSVGTSRRCRLFGIFCSSFSRHISLLLSAIRYLPLLVQPTHHSGVGCSVSSRCSADISRRCRLFIHWDIVSATLASCSLIFPLQNLIHAICIFRATPIRQTFCCQFFIWKERMETEMLLLMAFCMIIFFPQLSHIWERPQKLCTSNPHVGQIMPLPFFRTHIWSICLGTRVTHGRFDKCLRQLFQFRICYGFPHILQFTEMLRNLPRKNAVTPHMEPQIENSGFTYTMNASISIE